MSSAMGPYYHVLAGIQEQWYSLCCFRGLWKSLGQERVSHSSCFSLMSSCLMSPGEQARSSHRVGNSPLSLDLEGLSPASGFSHHALWPSLPFQDLTMAALSWGSLSLLILKENSCQLLSRNLPASCPHQPCQRAWWCLCSSSSHISHYSSRSDHF